MNLRAPLRLLGKTAAILTLVGSLTQAAPRAKSPEQPSSKLGPVVTLPPPLTPDEEEYGGELDFVNRKVANGDYGGDENGDGASYQAADENMAARDEWAQIVMKMCEARQDCTVTPVREEFYAYDRENESGYVVEDDEGNHAIKYYKVEYKDGWFFNINIDPASVEVQLGKLAASQWAHNVDRLQHDVYDTAKKAGLKVENPGNTQYHQGSLKAFKGDVKKFRNWIVDRWNHQELALLVGNDVQNAPPLSLLSKDKWTVAEKIIHDIDTGKIKTVEAAASRINTQVYNVTHNTQWRIDEDGTVVAKKYQGENLVRTSRKYAPADRTTETRYLPAATNARDYNDWVQLQALRTKWLNSQTGRVKFWRYNPQAPEAAMATNFRRFVEEAGGDWQNYRRFLKPEQRKLAQKAYSKTEFEEDGPTLCMTRNLLENFIPLDWVH